MTIQEIAELGSSQRVLELQKKARAPQLQLLRQARLHALSSELRKAMVREKEKRINAQKEVYQKRNAKLNSNKMKHILQLMALEKAWYIQSIKEMYGSDITIEQVQRLLVRRQHARERLAHIQQQREMR